MHARWTKSAPEARHDGAKMAMLAATWSFWGGFGNIFGPLFGDYWENCRSVKTNDPPSFLMVFEVFGARLGGFGSSFGECLGAVLGDFGQDGEQERQDGDQELQADAT